MQTYFASPLPNASNMMAKLTGLIMQKCGPWFATNDLARFAKAKAFNGLEWQGVPFMLPFARSIFANSNDFVYGGFFPDLAVNPISLKMLENDLERTNLVYHDWEMTGSRIDQWLYMGQFIRMESHKIQLPSHSAGLAWLRAIAPKLGDSRTDITRTRPDQLSLVRESSIGFTAIELHLLADWLESPQFPRDLYSLSVSPGNPVQ